MAVSREHPAAVRELRAELRANLDQADAAHREGRFEHASALLERTLDTLHDHPDIPGAAASAREAHLLAARIAWARSDPSGAEQALSNALRLDPEARLAIRQAPPELIDRYEALQANLLASREHAWINPQIVSGPDPSIEVEIDGVPGLRPVPPGPHFVVVYRHGCAPEAAWRELDDEWTLPDARERVSVDADVEHEAICRALALEQLVLAEQRNTSVGLQSYRCGVGWGPLWSGPRERLATAASTVLAGPFDHAKASLAGRWSSPPSSLASEPAVIDVDSPRPWYRRGWIWGTSASVAAVVAGSVVAGVLLGARRQPTRSLEIDANDFIAGP